MSQRSNQSPPRERLGDRRYLRSRDIYLCRQPIISIDPKTGTETKTGRYHFLGMYRQAAPWETAELNIYNDQMLPVALIKFGR